MKERRYSTKEEWLKDRLGKITGTRVKDIGPKLRGTGKKKGFYTLIAERLAIPRDDENPMDRGIRLEVEALAAFKEETGYPLDQTLRIRMRDDDENIAYSPDATVIDKPWSVEVKCLADEIHIETFLTQEVPDEYDDQITQGFVVDDDLEKVFMVFFDPNLSVHKMFYLEINRDQDKVNRYLKMEREVLEEVRQIVSDLSF